jgi:SAM-dependent methyltransferase
MSGSGARTRLVRPYSRLAATYDQTLGWASFVRTRRAFERLVRHYGIRFASAADLGCGTGLFACYLSRRWGVPVFAVDRSPEMLRVARCNCPDRGVCWLRQDLRCLRLPCPVDLATANFDTVNHLLTAPSLRAAFRRVYANLRPGGWFVFDFVTPRLPRDGLRAYFRRFRRLGLRPRRRIRWDPRTRILTILIERRAPAGCVPEMEVHRERAYAPRQVVSRLREAGFLVRGLHDAWTLRLPENIPERMFVVAQKRRRREER